MTFRMTACVTTALLCSAATVGAQTAPLPALGADPARVSVSGLSSGAYMAGQYGVTYSQTTMGVGIVAGGPFDCGAIAQPAGVMTNIPAVLSLCMQGKPSGAKSWKQARRYAKDKVIDPLVNIRRQKIYLFSGTRGMIVGQPVMKAVGAFYRTAGVPAANVVSVTSMQAPHAFISEDIGGAAPGEGLCGALGASYVVRCTVGGTAYDQPGAILRHIYGSLQPQATTLSAQPVAFDQRPYLAFGAAMADTGYVYVPQSCRTAGQSCAVHVVFHGCQQSARTTGVGDAVYARLGYNDWADSNRIIILYPQVEPSLLNPNGCWDWFGYTGPGFELHNGNQLKSVRTMVARLLAPA